MKNTITIKNTNDFINKVNTVSSIVKGKVIYNMESNILLEIKENELDKLYITSVDGNAWIISSIEIENAAEPMRIAIYAKKIKELLKNIKKDSVIKFEVVNNERMYININNDKTLIVGMKADDFPTVDNAAFDDMNKFAAFNGSVLSKQLAKLVKYTTKEPFKPTQQGVYFDFEKSNIVATDGKRLHIENMFDTQNKELSNVIIHRDYIDVLRKNIKDDSYIYTNKEKNCDYAYSYIYIISDNTQYIITAIEGKYPDYEMITSKIKADYNFTLDTKEVKIALKSIKPMISDSRCKRMVIQNKSGVIHFVAYNEDFSNDAGDISISMYLFNSNKNSMEDFEIAFNINFLDDVIKSYKDGVITFELSNGVKPSLINGSVIMPMGLTDENSNIQKVTEFIENIPNRANIYDSLKAPIEANNQVESIEPIEAETMPASSIIDTVELEKSIYNELYNKVYAELRTELYNKVYNELKAELHSVVSSQVDIPADTVEAVETIENTIKSSIVEHTEYIEPKQTKKISKKTIRKMKFSKIKAAKKQYSKVVENEAKKQAELIAKQIKERYNIDVVNMNIA